MIIIVVAVGCDDDWNRLLLPLLLWLIERMLQFQLLLLLLMLWLMTTTTIIGGGGVDRRVVIVVAQWCRGGGMMYIIIRGVVVICPRHDGGCRFIWYMIVVVVGERWWNGRIVMVRIIWYRRSTGAPVRGRILLWLLKQEIECRWWMLLLWRFIRIWMIVVTSERWRWNRFHAGSTIRTHGRFFLFIIMIITFVVTHHIRTISPEGCRIPVNEPSWSYQIVGAIGRKSIWSTKLDDGDWHSSSTTLVVNSNTFTTLTTVSENQRFGAMGGISSETSKREVKHESKQALSGVGGRDKYCPNSN